eukprot:Opistho-1_new@56878
MDSRRVCGGKVMLAVAFVAFAVMAGARAADTCNPAWTSSELSVPRAGLSAIAVDDLALFIGGSNGPARATFSVIDIYNTTSRRWSSTSLTSEREQVATTYLASENVVIFAGGRTATGVISNLVEAYNPKTGAWASTTLKTARYGASVEITYPSSTAAPRIVVIGGWDGTGPSNAFDVFTFSAGKFTTVSVTGALKAKHAFAASAVWNSGTLSRIFVAGGITDGATTNTDQIEVMFEGSSFSSSTAVKLGVARHA